MKKKKVWISERYKRNKMALGHLKFLPKTASYSMHAEKEEAKIRVVPFPSRLSTFSVQLEVSNVVHLAC